MICQSLAEKNHYNDYALDSSTSNSTSDFDLGLLQYYNEKDGSKYDCMSCFPDNSILSSSQNIPNITASVFSTIS